VKNAIEKEEAISKIKSAVNKIHGSGLDYDFENFRIRCRNTGRALGIRDMLTDTSYHTA